MGAQSSPALISVSSEISAASDRRLHELHDYWNSRIGNHPMPSRADIDPLDIPTLLPHIFLVDILENPRDFRFRLAGTNFREFAGTEVTGRRIGEVFPPAFNAEVHHHWSKCVEEGQLAVGSGKLWIAERDHVVWEGVVLPLSRDPAQVDMLLGGVVFKLLNAPPVAA